MPNAEDGVAGLTQNAVRPGASYTYRFIAADAGTYWYHSHQETERQLPLGMYGALVVDSSAPSARYDRDYTVFLHEWGAVQGGLLSACHATCPETLSIDARVDRISLAALPGETVRLHIANSGNDVHLPVLVGAAVKVIALDRHDLNAPAHNGTPLAGSPARLDTLLVNPGEAYDVAFLADNPGLWRLHCHMVEHDARGMDMMVNYASICTPYSIGSASGNNPF